MLESRRILELELILGAVAGRGFLVLFLSLRPPNAVLLAEQERGLINLRKLTLKVLTADSNQGLGDSKSLRLTVL